MLVVYSDVHITYPKLITSLNKYKILKEEPLPKGYFRTSEKYTGLQPRATSSDLILID